MAKRSRAERSNAIALLASFLVIAAGLAAAVVVCTISAPDPKVALPIAVLLFLMIAAIPFNALRARSDLSTGKVERVSLAKRIRFWWWRRKQQADDDDEPKIWKRKRLPKKSEISVFVAETDRPPSMG